MSASYLWVMALFLRGKGCPFPIIYFEKIRALKAGVWPCRLQHGIIEYDFGLILLVSLAEVMIKRSDWGRSDSTARGENLGFVDDDLQRKHSARTDRKSVE